MSSRPEVWFVWYGGGPWQRLFDFVSYDSRGEPDTYLYASVRGAQLSFLDDELDRSLFHVDDPEFKGSIEEFRIYEAVLTPEMVARSSALGPDARFP